MLPHQFSLPLLQVDKLHLYFLKYLLLLHDKEICTNKKKMEIFQNEENIQKKNIKTCKRLPAT